MGTVKTNPNERQIREAKTTRPGSLQKSKSMEDREMQDRKPTKVKGAPDEGAADETPFDAKKNNIHKKR
jgi:hypothetical protein